MAARKRKLTEADKHEILNLYRQPEHTTLTLAELFGVSNSTISRWLKNSISPEEYEVLIQQKRSSRGGGEKRKTRRSRSSRPSPEPATATDETGETTTRRRRRKRSTDSDVEIDVPSLAEAAPPQLVEQLAMFDAEEDDMEDDDLEEEAAIETPKLKRTAPRRSSRRGDEVTVLPLSEATLPQAFYLVVDRAAELITRPLKEFDELGPVPDSETQQRTLPIFDNHRVARRFSARNQRVIKVPDSNLLQKAVSYLQDKGITRLLFDGRVYALDR